jgi:hypothetical protein
VEVVISLVSGDQVTGLESLADWLRGEPELAGRVSVVGCEPGEGHLGALGDALIVAVGSGGALSVLSASLKGWLLQPRRSDFRMRIQRPDGHVVEIAADRANAEHVDVLLREALRDQAAQG